MSSITINVPKGTETQYKTFINVLVKNFSASELEDTLLGLHIEKNRKINDFVSENEVFSALKNG